MKLGRRDVQECFGRVDTTVTDYGFGPNADYAVGSGSTRRRSSPTAKGPMSWNRHVLFLKTSQADGPSYFVMRDTFPAEAKRPSWWEWMNLDTADLIQVEGKAFDPARTPVDKVVPENQFPRLRGQVVEMKTRHGASTWFWFSEPREVGARMTFTAAKETKTIAVIAGAPGQDFFYVVYPRRTANPRRPVRCWHPAPSASRRPSRPTSSSWATRPSTGTARRSSSRARRAPFASWPTGSC